MKDYSELKECAENATKGDWWIDSHGHAVVSHSEDGTRLVFRADDSMGPATRHPETGNLSHWPNDWDASFIVSAQPAVILALITEVENLRGCDTAYAEVWEKARVLQSEIDEVRKDAGRYRWLREKDWVQVEVDVRCGRSETLPEMDEAIDAAMAMEARHD